MKNFQERGVSINADAGSGHVKVEILDANDQAVEGFTKEEARPITEDQLRARASWAEKSDVSALRGRRVKLRLFVRNAHLYSTSILDGGGDE